MVRVVLNASFIPGYTSATEVPRLVCFAFRIIRETFGRTLLFKLITPIPIRI